jgi:hypothetical protein
MYLSLCIEIWLIKNLICDVFCWVFILTGTRQGSGIRRVQGRGAFSPGCVVGAGVGMRNRGSGGDRERPPAPPCPVAIPRVGQPWIGQTDLGSADPGLPRGTCPLVLEAIPGVFHFFLRRCSGP